MTLRTFRRRDGFRPPLAGRAPEWGAPTMTFAGSSGTVPAPVTMTQAPRAHGTPLDVPAGPPEPPPGRPHDAAMFEVAEIDGVSQLVLLCGAEDERSPLRGRHTDPAVNYFAHAYDALRVSALRAGWRPDLFGRWCCPRCVMDPAYAAAKPLAHWHPGVPHAQTGADSFEPVRFWLERAATEHHWDASAAFAAGDPAAEFWFRAEAELDMLTRTAQAAVHGRHEAGAR